MVDHVGQPELARLYNRARSVFVPCELQGGGERAVHEGRACGCAGEIAADNPTLATLTDIPVPSHEQYAQQILDCLVEVVEGRRVPLSVRRSAYARFEAAVIGDKLRRAPQTARIRWRNRRSRQSWAS